MRQKTMDKTSSEESFESVFEDAPDNTSLGRDDLDPMSRLGGDHFVQTEVSTKRLPTVFKWDGGGKTVFLSGSFDNWKSKIPMSKSHNDFYTIVEVPEGVHQFKYLVDGQWVCDTNQTQVDNDMGSKNNQVTVSRSDFEVFEALAMDSNPDSAEGKAGVSTSPKVPPGVANLRGASSPQGEYSQYIPPRNSGTGYHHGAPPVLPPHLLQVILNKDIPVNNEPNLLPEPNHVMLNHLYALSIKDGVMVLSATHRYRKKYVTTLLYKPIQ